MNRRPMVPITGSGRSVKKRFNDLRQIVNCLVNDLRIPLYHGFNTDNGFKHLLDYCLEIGSWVAYTIFLEYFPEWKNGSKYIVAGEKAVSMFRPGDHVHADLPFFLSKLLPYTSRDELVRAGGLYRNMKSSIGNSNLYHSTSDPKILPILSDMLNIAIAEREGGDFRP